MINQLSQTEAARQGIPSTRIQNISPYVNPAHVLAPPRKWVEGLVKGTYTWPFFRLRYKALLRDRYQKWPERFESLLMASHGANPLFLTCHCMTELCHRELALEFLEKLRLEHPFGKPSHIPVNHQSSKIRLNRKAGIPNSTQIINALVEPPRLHMGQHNRNSSSAASSAA